MLTAETMIESLKGKKLIEGAEWFKENDPEMLDWVYHSDYWGRGFDEIPNQDQAVIEIQFTEGGIDVYATHKGSGYEDCPSRNQPPWNPRGDKWEGVDGWINAPKLLANYYHTVVSKKQKILDIISENPFLNLEEIAEFADCGSNYVRTILSQEGLTLTELRKRFAEKAAKEGIKLEINR